MSVPRCVPSRRLRPGSPAAPGASRLGLLPSGPDPVHGAPPRRTQPSTPRARCFPNGRHPQAGSSAPRIEGFGCRTPLASRLARSREMVPEEAGCFLPQEGAARRWGRWPRRSRGRRGFVLFPPLASGASVGGGGRGGAEDGGGRSHQQSPLTALLPQQLRRCGTFAPTLNAGETDENGPHQRWGPVGDGPSGGRGIRTLEGVVTPYGISSAAH